MDRRTRVRGHLTRRSHTAQAGGRPRATVHSEGTMARTDGGTPWLNLEVTTADGSRVVVCGGEVDAASGGVLVGEVARQCERGARLVVVDLSEITFFGAAGINALIAAHRAANAAGSRMVAAGSPRCVRRPFDLTGARLAPSTVGPRRARLEFAGRYRPV
ncbi:STAS domain-containing protein [Saccharothrix sp.]|uniref:STAS domain-containing protein n=1 Tax=Saccharothrix sp. TaxID=1873460 RepID=UPI00281135D8|nr:STAS domain-containing protein [Saccharothrix sp.]